jgi:large subunit ribosomal protein L18
MNRLVAKREAIAARKKRVRRKVFGTAGRPRLTVYKSGKHVYAQIIDDATGRTLVAASSMGRDLRDDLKTTGTVEAAKTVGAAIGKKALARDITQVVFDRNGYPFHGKVKALADAAREAGLQF